MGLFGFGKKKEKERCGICGRELSREKFTVSDGSFCGDCWDKISKLMPVEQWSELSCAELARLLEDHPQSAEAPVDSTICPACGKPYDTEYPTKVADGSICKACDKRMRGGYFRETITINPKNPQHREKYAYEIRQRQGKERNGTGGLLNYDTVTEDELSDVTVAEIKEDIALFAKRKAEAIAAFGGKYQHIFCVDEGFEYTLGAVEGGISRVKKYKGKLVVNGIVACGEFSRENTAFLISGGHERPVRILEPVPCAGGCFETEISTYVGKPSVTTDDNAWLVLDMDFEEVKLGDIIAK